LNEVRRLRELKGLSQTELAELAGLVPSTVSLFENGYSKPHPATLRKLADALDVEVADLFEQREPRERLRSGIMCPNCGHTIVLDIGGRE